LRQRQLQQAPERLAHARSSKATALIVEANTAPAATAAAEAAVAAEAYIHKNEQCSGPAAPGTVLGLAGGPSLHSQCCWGLDTSSAAGGHSSASAGAPGISAACSMSAAPSSVGGQSGSSGDWQLLVAELGVADGEVADTAQHQTASDS